MIPVTETITIDEQEIKEEFVRSSGPGGQNVNKVSTAVQLRFDVANSPNLPDDVRQRLITAAGKRITRDGVLVIDARTFRTQERNRRDAFDRLAAMIRQAAERPRLRRKTNPSLEAKKRRLEQKRHRGETKRFRKPVGKSEE